MNEGTDDQSAMPSMDELKTLPKEELEEPMKGFFQRENKNPRDILFQMTKKAKEEAGDLPLYYTEWNGSKEYDTSYRPLSSPRRSRITTGWSRGIPSGRSRISLRRWG